MLVSPSKSDYFAHIAEAYSVLSHPEQRQTYDMVRGYKAADGTNMWEQARLRKRDALLEASLMANANSSSQQRELAVKGGGLIVQCAFYGALKRAIVPYLDIEDQAVGPIIDVTVPVQVRLLHRSRYGGTVCLSVCLSSCLSLLSLYLSLSSLPLSVPISPRSWSIAVAYSWRKGRASPCSKAFTTLAPPPSPTTLKERSTSPKLRAC